MKERPILFSGPMVRAILDGRKTQTRRVYKAKRGFPYQDGEITPNPNESSTWTEWGPCPYGQPGDRLWVRETWQRCLKCSSLEYLADCNKDLHCRSCDALLFQWKPSIFMFRDCSRINLEVESVRVESLTEIRERDARAEGIERIPRPEFGDSHWRNYGPPALINIGTHAERQVHYSDPIGSYKSLWNSINGPGSWDSNPWVWVIEFKKL